MFRMFNHYKNLFATKSFELRYHILLVCASSYCTNFLLQPPYLSSPFLPHPLHHLSDPIRNTIHNTQHNPQQADLWQPGREYAVGGQASWQGVPTTPGAISSFWRWWSPHLLISFSGPLRRFFPPTVSYVKSPMLCICNSNGRCSATPGVSLEGSGTHFHTAELTGCRTGRPVSWCSQRGTSLQRLPWQCAFPPPHPSARLQPSVSPAGTRTHSRAPPFTPIGGFSYSDAQQPTTYSMWCWQSIQRPWLSTGRNW